MGKHFSAPQSCLNKFSVNRLTDFPSTLYRDWFARESKELSAAIFRVYFDEPPQTPEIRLKNSPRPDYSHNMCIGRDISIVAVEVNANKWNVRFASPPADSSWKALEVIPGRIPLFPPIASWHEAKSEGHLAPSVFPSHRSGLRTRITASPGSGCRSRNRKASSRFVSPRPRLVFFFFLANIFFFQKKTRRMWSPPGALCSVEHSNMWIHLFVITEFHVRSAALHILIYSNFTLFLQHYFHAPILPATIFHFVSESRLLATCLAIRGE